MSQMFTVAIDGPSGAGKSTIAKLISARTGALYLDTGAMYRAIGLFMVRNGVDPRDADGVRARLAEPEVRIAYDNGMQRVFLFDEDVSDAIRRHEISDAASAVSAIPEVREKLVAMQQKIAAGQSSVLDGRDIGTKVLPAATLKIFLVASPEVRARRRFDELIARGAEATYEQVLSDMRKRDHDDSTRAASPLTKAEDAVEIDSSALSPGEVAQRVIDLLEQRLGVAS